MEDVFKTLDLSDDKEIFRGYTKMIELYNALKFITMLFLIQKILRFNLGVAFLKSVSIYANYRSKDAVNFCWKNVRSFCINLRTFFKQKILGL